MNRNSLHPLGTWYQVAAVYEGEVFSNYVNGVEQGAAVVVLSSESRLQQRVEAHSGRARGLRRPW